MIERSTKPIAEFFLKYGDRGGRWFLDIQFGRLCWASDTIAQGCANICVALHI